MQQYWEIKSQHQDEVVLFRMGDFFEMFHQDAETAAPILNIALTQRNKKSNDSTKMCGVPHHSIAGPIAKLLQAGFKVAICDQIEDPALAKGIVKRAVTRVLTPGMVYDPDTLDQLTANYMAAYDESRVAFADITTGEAFVYDFAHENEREELLSLLRPVELVLTSKQMLKRDLLAFKTMGSPLDAKFESEQVCVERLKAYIEKMQGAEVLKGLGVFEVRQRQTLLRISSITLRHLEVFENSRGERQGSLFEAINRTQTSAGARLLKSWLTSPLRQVDELQRRQAEIRLWMERGSVLKTFRQTLARLGDIERRLGKVHSTTFNGRDLLAIAQSVQAGCAVSEMHPAKPILQGLDTAAELATKIERTLNDELPLSVKEGGLIRKGAVAELDELIELTQNTQKLLLELEARERAATGVASLKVRYNNVFGFYIELTNTHSHKALKHYRRKQTLANAERYTTDELDKLEEKILSAKSRRDTLEYEIFSKLRQDVIALTPDLLRLSREWTRWDVLSALAWLSLERNYVCPVFCEEGSLHIELSRHPVVEQTLNSGFVPNTIRLTDGEALLLTGPNMAGKSTLMRQVALIALMAQIGSFVPAAQATLPVFEEIFTRIGASDALNEGLSTFMVEMSETSEILKRVNARSLVIMDEIGRGTSTYDGLSLAQAILEYLVAQKRPYLFFATHYHELTRLTQVYPQIYNAHMSVQEKGGQIQFLHTLKEGPANRSYGIHVAKLAGLPPAVTGRAQILLKGFEAGPASQQLSFGDMEELAPAPPPWLEEVKALNLAQMTPLEALNKLFEWQREASS
ncbi:MAG: DNA mismatch repair protein MutS [Bdellovibrionales bacterium]|nr:DNA mismatch repair protein MutS [Bdellovibrionales bacterium]